MGSVLRAAGPFNVKKIAIIGAGPAGMAVAKFLIAEEYFEKIDIYEQQSEVGGVWNYTPKEGEKVPVPSTSPNVPPEKPFWPDGAKAPIFPNPMYEHLNTNIPKRLMAYSDLEFLPESLLFPTRQDVQDYLIRYSQDIRSLISFTTQVEDIRSLEGSRWELTARSTVTGKSTKALYDAVIVSNGHYSVPFIPSVAGIEAFNTAYPNIITHSKIYRSPEVFVNKKVIVVGSGASGLDISTQISLVCQKPLLNSVRTTSLLQFGQENKKEVPPIDEYLVEERGVRFEDGRIEKDIDAIVYATGYFYSYPFLKSLDPRVLKNGRRVMGLYQHIFSIDHRTLAFMALPQKVNPFPISEVQAAALSKVWSNRLDLPTKEEMITWEKKRAVEAGDGTGFHKMGFPADAEYLNYLHDLVKPCGFKKEPTYWDAELLWFRKIYVDIRKKFIEEGGVAKTVEELGFRYDERDDVE
ncbi:Thiol-specific monooxygenase [Lachnellula suecica]|uniref:Thiol-specific monooxygenase n=1 Tax=Lachnellula suecica TaxID=602035 RepID=A0A8T9CJN8_9HELO|nr:Thiol-specific monooxygenase [Lachnellula suecica]